MCYHCSCFFLADLMHVVTVHITACLPACLHERTGYCTRSFGSTLIWSPWSYCLCIHYLVNVSVLLAVVCCIVFLCVSYAGPFIKQQGVISHRLKELYIVSALFKLSPEADYRLLAKQWIGNWWQAHRGPEAQVAHGLNFSSALSTICHAQACSCCASTCQLSVKAPVRQKDTPAQQPAVDEASGLLWQYGVERPSNSPHAFQKKTTSNDLWMTSVGPRRIGRNVCLWSEQIKQPIH